MLLVVNGRLGIRLLSKLRLTHDLVLQVVPVGTAVDLGVVVPWTRPVLSHDAAVVVLLPIIVEHSLEDIEITHKRYRQSPVILLIIFYNCFTIVL